MKAGNLMSLKMANDYEKTNHIWDQLMMANIEIG